MGLWRQRKGRRAPGKGDPAASYSSRWEQSMCDHLPLWCWLQNHSGTTSFCSPRCLAKMLICRRMGFRHCRNMFPRFPHAILDASLLFLVGLYQGLFFAHLLKVLSFLQPLLQQGPQLTHILETELQDLKAGDGHLAEHLSKENI